MHQADPDIRNRLLVARLPAMPQILLKLIEQCQSEQVGMAALAELIAKDPGMTGKILGVANSSAYHRSGRKVGLEHSLMALGVDMIKTLVISESVFQVFNNFSHANSTDLRGFWQHSLSAAVMAREIAAKMRYPHTEEAYLAGLLHDVGRLALLAVAPGEYALNFLAVDDDNLCAVEQRTLSISHPEAGAWLVERWNLDSFLADSVLYHHEPAARLELAHPLVRIVLLAHLLSLHGEDDPDVMEAGSLCGIEAKDLVLISRGAQSQVRTSAEYLGIDLDGVDTLPVRSASDTERPVQDPVHQQLSEEIRNLVLTSDAGRSFSNQQGEAGLLQSVSRSARLLFDFQDVIILLMNGTGQALVGVPVGEHKQRLREFSIALAGGGVLAEVALQRRLAFISRDENSLGIVEEQLLRVLDSHSLVCLPLISGSRCLGVMIGGLASWQVSDLQQRERFLRSFAEQAAAALEAALGERGETSRRVASVAEEYREASRRVAHEVNNPLSIIKNYLSVLGSKLDKQEPVVGEMSILNEEIDRVGQIIKGLADLKPTLRQDGAEVNRVVRDVIRLFRDTEFVPDAVQIIAQTQDLPSVVEGNADTLKQILVNLVKNAIEAMPGGGEIHIANSGHVNRDGFLYTELCVRDSGPGIPTEILANLFSPVRSTKGNGHRGLGLSIVHSLVKKNQGLITCRSGSKGTAFEILLPVRKRAGQATHGRDSA
ncbi:MAG: HDOD domain-containing protein [Propionivibrio sp.]|uniref:HDOD domain-containing protein n=1 Tax=Propionivibrio sp. TaxID=2212460 RepID=UPI001A621E14|nr:HDOD domain-containing protein [Propionivibrio sp.]MBL8415887.1 HDOD domain-containing protein [Propionivibrio sp.]